MGVSVDVREFHPVNITDTCSVWNLLSSEFLYQTAVGNGCYFGCTQYVLYECLIKARATPTSEDEQLQERLRKEQTRGQFTECFLTLDDLNDPDIVKYRSRLDRGELSTLAFAKKSGQAFLSDDQKARGIVATIIDRHKVQTIPHLLGWLFFTEKLSDTDLEPILAEHERMRRPLKKHFEKIYLHACEARLRESS